MQKIIVLITNPSARAPQIAQSSGPETGSASVSEDKSGSSLSASGFDIDPAAESCTHRLEGPAGGAEVATVSVDTGRGLRFRRMRLDALLLAEEDTCGGLVEKLAESIREVNSESPFYSIIYIN